MTPQTVLLIKAIAGTALVVALVIGFLERWFTPNYLVTEDSREIPPWIGWLGWILAALGTITYVAIDFV